MTAQVTVRDDTNKRPRCIGDAHAAESFRGYFNHGLGHLRALYHKRQPVAGVHDLPNKSEDCAELSAWMQCLEIECSKTATLEKSDSERVTERELNQGGSRRR